MRPDERDAALLKAMLDACRDVVEFTNGLTLEQFIKDRRARLLTERCLEIVGEASKKVSPGLRAEISWQIIRRVLETSDHFLVFQNRDCAYSLPKRAFNDEALVSARQVFRAKLGERAEVQGL